VRVRRVTVLFEDGTDVQLARTLVSERLQDVRGVLPSGAEATLGPLSGATNESYLYPVEDTTYRLSLTQLRTIRDRIVRPELRTVPGVTEINGWGGLVRQAQVVIHPERLANYGITLHDAVVALAATNSAPAGGYIEHGDEQYILRGIAQATTLDDLRHAVIRSNDARVPILLGDVAAIGFDPALRQGAPPGRSARALRQGAVSRDD
jgi:cobalt-zinc-cadmium resistance protein CzcA